MTSIEVSVVMPCLNECPTVGGCVSEALAALQKKGLAGEVIICDNGSSDGSQEIARKAGARVVPQPLRGYGRAYQEGLRHAQGRYIVIADSDGTYDLNEIPRFVQALREGADFVTGTRFSGNTVEGMPLLHRYIGNPLLTLLLNYLFQTDFSDVYCGMRAFTREAYRRIAPRSQGMEFNLELAIHAKKAGLRCAEIPIRLRSRRIPAKLRTFKDGWRSLRLLLLYSPNSLFLTPALSCLLASGGLFVLSFFLSHIWVQLQAAASVLAIIGGQVLQFWIVARGHSLSEKVDPQDPFLSRLLRLFSIERGLALGALLVLSGGFLAARLCIEWVQGGLAAQNNRWGYIALTLIALGVQIIAGSFFIGLLAMKKLRDSLVDDA